MTQPVAKKRMLLPINLSKISTDKQLIKKAKWLEGKTLKEIARAIISSDKSSRVKTKGNVGYVIEKGFFGIEKNSDANPDIEHLGIEIKTCPLMYNSDRTLLSVKEPLSLNIINYMEEYKHKNLKESSIYKKNHKILFVLYIHEKSKPRSKYRIKYVFLWKMNNKVLSELENDYQLILAKIRAGEAREIHQDQHKYLTLCPKHSGTFKDPNCKKSKRPQPFNTLPAEVRGFRLKNSYMDIIITKALGKKLVKGGWSP